MPHRILTNEEERATFVRFVQGVPLPHTFEWQPGRDRTPDQNRLMWLWATEAAHQRGDVTPAEVQREWKLRFGVPILREDSVRFQQVYDSLIKDRLTYEEKVDAMEFIDVTSAMKVRQMVRFLDTVQRECLQRGLKLTDPDPELAAYQSRYRMKEAA